MEERWNNLSVEAKYFLYGATAMFGFLTFLYGAML